MATVIAQGARRPRACAATRPRADRSTASVLRIRRADSARIVERAPAPAQARTTSAGRSSCSRSSTTCAAVPTCRSCAHTRTTSAGSTRRSSRCSTRDRRARRRRPSPAALAAAKRRPKSGRRRSRPASAACPRSGPRSTACGRCSPGPSSSTTCSASRGLIRSATDGVLDATTSPSCCSGPGRASVRDVAVDRGRRRRSSTRPTRCSARSKRPACAGGAPVERRRGSTTPPASIERARPRRVHRPRRGRGALRRWLRGTRPNADTEPRTFGHVLVDEAQDLTAMQWRMLARRCPTGSMTLVGDFGQAARPGALARLGRGARAAAGAPAGRGSSTLTRQLPHAGRDHGGRRPRARRRRTRHRAGAVGAQHRRAAPLRRPPTTRRAASPPPPTRVRAVLGEGGTVGGDRTGRAPRCDRRRARRRRRRRRRARDHRRAGRGARRLGGEGPRVRPRRRGRAERARHARPRRAPAALRDPHPGHALA